MAKRVKLNTHNLPVTNVKSMRLKEDLIGEKGDYLVYSEEEDKAVVLNHQDHANFYSEAPSPRKNGKRSYGWTRVDTQILAILFHEGDWMFNTDIARRMGVPARSIYHRVKKLLKTERIIESKGYGRGRVQYRVNDAGKAKYQQLVDAG